MSIPQLYLSLDIVFLLLDCQNNITYNVCDVSIVICAYPNLHISHYVVLFIMFHSAAFTVNYYFLNIIIISLVKLYLHSSSNNNYLIEQVVNITRLILLSIKVFMNALLFIGLSSFQLLSNLLLIQTLRRLTT